MAATYDKTNGIITLSALNEEMGGVHSISHVVFYGTGAGPSELQDLKDKTLALCNLTTDHLTIDIPLKRTVNGVKVTTLAANQKILIYLEKS
jgi:hypothetical protein